MNLDTADITQVTKQNMRAGGGLNYIFAEHKLKKDIGLYKQERKFDANYEASKSEVKNQPTNISQQIRGSHKTLLAAGYGANNHIKQAASQERRT